MAFERLDTNNHEPSPLRNLIEEATWRATSLFLATCMVGCGLLIKKRVAREIAREELQAAHRKLRAAA